MVSCGTVEAPAYNHYNHSWVTETEHFLGAGPWVFPLFSHNNYEGGSLIAPTL